MQPRFLNRPATLEVVQPYRSLSQRVFVEVPRIKGSRFLAAACPVDTVEQALAFLAEVRRREHQARHHAWAYRLQPEQALFRSSDDGEPSGSAGKPILSALVGRELYAVAVVVTRYLGGVKLGVGGLVRAYGGAAAHALDAALICEVVPRTKVHVSLAYDEVGRFQLFCTRLGLPRAEIQYGENVCCSLAVSATELALFQSAVSEASRGRWQVEIAPM